MAVLEMSNKIFAVNPHRAAKFTLEEILAHITRVRLELNHHGILMIHKQFCYITQ